MIKVKQETPSDEPSDDEAQSHHSRSRSPVTPAHRVRRLRSAEVDHIRQDMEQEMKRAVAQQEQIDAKQEQVDAGQLDVKQEQNDVEQKNVDVKQEKVEVKQEKDDQQDQDEFVSRFSRLEREEQAIELAKYTPRWTDCPDTVRELMKRNQSWPSSSHQTQGQEVRYLPLPFTVRELKRRNPSWPGIRDRDQGQEVLANHQRSHPGHPAAGPPAPSPAFAVNPHAISGWLSPRGLTQAEEYNKADETESDEETEEESGSSKSEVAHTHTHEEKQEAKKNVEKKKTRKNVEQKKVDVKQENVKQENVKQENVDNLSAEPASAAAMATKEKNKRVRQLAMACSVARKLCPGGNGRVVVGSRVHTVAMKILVNWQRHETQEIHQSMHPLVINVDPQPEDQPVPPEAEVLSD
jgi:hypothetical protein